VEVPYFLNKYDPDPLRFYLTATAPETRDTEFSWEDFVERNNHVLRANGGNELVATWGNLANAQEDLGPPEGTRVHAELRPKVLRRAHARAGQPFAFLQHMPSRVHLVLTRSVFSRSWAELWFLQTRSLFDSKSAT
jgi:methionyl-tRNA synthetase